MKILGLNINWVTSACYLSAIEILTISKRQELGLVKDKKTEVNLPFNKKLDDLFQELFNPFTSNRPQTLSLYFV